MGKPSSGQMKEFWNQVESGRINSANLQRFLTNPEWLPVQVARSDEFYKITADHLRSVEDLAEALEYDWVLDDKETSKNSPLSGEGWMATEIVLVHLNHSATIEEIESELDKRGLRAARIEELLALSAAYPHLQHQFPIAALGSRYLPACLVSVPVLHGSGPWRGVNPHSINRFSGDFRFAAVRK